VSKSEFTLHDILLGLTIHGLVPAAATFREFQVMAVLNGFLQLKQNGDAMGWSGGTARDLEGNTQQKRLVET